MSPGLPIFVATRRDLIAPPSVVLVLGWRRGAAKFKAPLFAKPILTTFYKLLKHLGDVL